MSKVEFNYNGVVFLVQCQNDDKMKDIISKFLTKAGRNKKNIYFLYNGRVINEELAFNKCANSLDRSRNYMNVLVIEGQGSDDEVVNLLKSKYIICPKCNENANISINDFQISISGCINGHKNEVFHLNEFEKTQFIDQTKIICDGCKNAKSEIPDNKFFVCFSCNQNLCPSCKNQHNKSHKLKDYEKKNFYCSIHCDSYIGYCLDCKKDICALCENEHKTHKLIKYDSIIQDINSLKEIELKNTKEKIYELKTIINEMLKKLNSLNKNLDAYFEIYNNIISQFDMAQKNYCLIQNVNNIRKYNDNFIIMMTEIIKNDNLKSQFTSIVTLHSKIEFKKKENNIIIRNKQKNESKSNDNKISNEIIQKDISDNNYTSKKYNSLDDKYENFNINNIKELQTFNTKFDVEKLLILHDRRILSLQRYSDEEEESHYKLCVYSPNDKFACDINMDIDCFHEIFQMDDEYVLIEKKKKYIKTYKINKNTIEEFWTFEDTISSFKKLMNNYFLLKIFKNVEKSNKPNPNNFFASINNKMKYSYLLFKYENGKLMFIKDISDIYDKEFVRGICQINEKEFAFYINKKGIIYGTNDFIIFYDIEKGKIIKSLKVGKGENSNEMYLFNKETLLVSGDSSIILVDPKNKKILKEYKYDISVEDIIYLNDKSFLDIGSYTISQYEFKNENALIVKEKRDINFEFILKYPDNKILIYEDKTIAIYG